MPAPILNLNITLNIYVYLRVKRISPTYMLAMATFIVVLDDTEKGGRERERQKGEYQIKRHKNNTNRVIQRK